MFDRFVVVDWSANSTPKLGRDSIWIGVADRDGKVTVTNHPTRHTAETSLADGFEADRDSNVLVGVDFSLGYPAGTAAALGAIGAPWSAMWAMLADRVIDDERNSNNRFVVAAALNRELTGALGPFWGCPSSATGDHLASTKPATAGRLAEFRVAEEVLRAQGRRPFSVWQLLGAGAVGSQSLLGVPMLERLRRRFPDRVQVWPFTTGLRAPALDGGAIVVVEVWPSMHEICQQHAEVRDAAQVRATARWLACSSTSGHLDELFEPATPPGTDATVVAEEGWVLGVTC